MGVYNFFLVKIFEVFFFFFLRNGIDMGLKSDKRFIC